VTQARDDVTSIFLNYNKMIDPALLELQKHLPFLPGHKFELSKVSFLISHFQNRQNERKSHAFDYCNGVAVFKSEAPGIGNLIIVPMVN
jgi:hypothetical protein